MLSLLLTSVLLAPQCVNGQCRVQVQRVVAPKVVAQQATVARQEVIVSPYVEQVRFIPLVDPATYDANYAQIVGVRQRYSNYAAQETQQFTADNEALKAQVEALATAINRLAEQLDRLETEGSGEAPEIPPLEGPSRIPPSPPETPAPEPGIQVEPPPNAPPQAPGTVSAPGEAVMSLLQAKCASCHSGATAKKGFKIFASKNGPLAPLKPADLVAMDLQIYDAAMPPDKALSNQEYSEFRQWLAENSASISSAVKACRK